MEAVVGQRWQPTRFFTCYQCPNNLFTYVNIFNTLHRRYLKTSCPWGTRFWYQLGSIICQILDSFRRKSVNGRMATPNGHFLNYISENVGRRVDSIQFTHKIVFLFVSNDHRVPFCFAKNLFINRMCIFRVKKKERIKGSPPPLEPISKIIKTGKPFPYKSAPATIVNFVYRLPCMQTSPTTFPSTRWTSAPGRNTNKRTPWTKTRPLPSRRSWQRRSWWEDRNLIDWLLDLGHRDAGSPKSGGEKKNLLLGLSRSLQCSPLRAKTYSSSWWRIIIPFVCLVETGQENICIE